MYTLLSTFPPHTSGNVGDKLLEEQVKKLIERETGVDEFNTVFRSEDFSSRINKLNESDAIILPAFALREPIHPDTYRLTEDIDSIKTPIIPLAANWSGYPGDKVQNENRKYSAETVKFIEKLDNQDSLSHLTTRDVYTKNILQRHGFKDAELVGDLGWYHEDYLGREMRTPEEINDIVITTPHHSHYIPQAAKLMDMLDEEFSDAKITVSFHSSLSESDRELRQMAEDRGFEIVLASHDTENIEFYDECDLHVGYRLHGHISFLRRRLPSVLIGEDGRGNGFNNTSHVGGFRATKRRLNPSKANLVRKFSNSLPGIGVRKVLEGKKYARNPYQQAIAPADMNVPEKIRDFLRKEIRNDFKSYERIPELFDQTYENSMKPFLKSLPNQ